jgi:DNA mismatch repair ATPase MutS
MANNFRDQHNLVSLKVQYNTKRGYYFTVPGTVKHIPAIFGHASMQGKKWILSTDQLETLNIRSKESLQDIYLMTERVIEGLIAEIRYYNILNIITQLT